MPQERQRFDAGMVALEAERALLGEAVVDSTLGPALHPANDFEARIHDRFGG